MSNSLDSHMAYKVSVITVCINNAATLKRALLSVSGQDWPAVEHIIIDGASTDATAKILDDFRYKLAHVISEPDNGIYDAMNKGLNIASGDIICFLNADDYYASEKVLSRVVEQMRLFKLDALVGDVCFFSEGKDRHIIRRYRSDRFSVKRLAWGWMPAHPGLFLRQEVVRRVGQFKTDYRIAGDYEYIVRAFCKNSLHFQHMPEVLVFMQSGGASSNGWRSKVLLNQEVLRACRENGLSTNMLKILSKYPAKLLEYLHT